MLILQTIRRVISIVFLSIMLPATIAAAADIKILAANAVKDSLTQAADLFEKTSGHKVVFVWGGTESLTKRTTDGEVFDLIFIARPNIDKLAMDGKLVQGSQKDFARSGVGIAVRSGLPKPDVSSRESVRTAILQAKSVAYSSGPSGFYIAELIKRLGIEEQTKDKVKQPPSGVQIGELIARGDADLGFQQISELIHVKGIDYLGPLPADIQNITTYSAGISTGSPSPEAARQFLNALATAEVGAIISKTGMTPP